MSDQETAVVEETTETKVEGVSETATSDPTPDVSEADTAAEIDQNSDDPAKTPTEEGTELTSSEAVESPVETSEEPASEKPDSILSLKSRQHFVGKVKNITQFGAFVDIGLPQDGLVHISELSRQKVDKVTDVVSEGQEIDVWVKKVDKKRGRISLTMVKPITRRFRDIKEEDEFEGVVTRLESYGAFIDIDSDREGLVHISQITHDYINHPEEALAIGDRVNVKVLKINRKKRQVDLSIKALLPPPSPPEPELVDEEPQVEEREVEAEEPAPTAMAIAYATFQGEMQTDESKKGSSKAKRQQKQEMDAIIARTLAGRDQ